MNFFPALCSFYCRYQEEKGGWNTKYFIFIQFSLYLIKHAIEKFSFRKREWRCRLREKACQIFNGTQVTQHKIFIKIFANLIILPYLHGGALLSVIGGHKYIQSKWLVMTLQAIKSYNDSKNVSESRWRELLNILLARKFPGITKTNIGFMQEVDLNVNRPGTFLWPKGKIHFVCDRKTNDIFDCSFQYWMM